MTQASPTPAEHRLHRGALRSSRKPLYQQIGDELREEIRRGEHPVGRFLPSEPALTRRFDASRHTIREALRLLEEAGLISRRRGAGSVVLSIEPHVHFGQTVRSIDDLLQYTETTDFHLRHTDRLLADAQLAGWLSTRIGTECVQLHGVRLGHRSRQPVAATDVFRRASWHGLPRGYERQEDAIRALLEEQFLSRIGRVEQLLSAHKMPAEAAHELLVAVGSPALRSVRRYFDPKGHLLLVVVALHPGEAFTYRMLYERSDVTEAAQA